MKLINLLFLLLFYTFSSLSAQNIEDWQGSWRGGIAIQGYELPIVIHLQHKGNDWKGQMDSPAQGAFDIAMDTVHIHDNKLYFVINAIGGKFTGTYTNTGIEGIWHQGQDFQLNFERANASNLLEDKKELIEQTLPQPPFPYIEEEVKVSNKKDKITLAGTLTYPNTKGKFPVAILIAGSGAQDRNSEILGHKPFLFIADFLTRNGIAVLRMDERGVGASTGSQTKATTADFATDIASAVAFLKKHPRIDKKNIGLIGHSEGGIIAPMVASKDKSIAFMILLAAPGVKSTQILSDQVQEVSKSILEPQQLKAFTDLMSNLYTAIALDTKDQKTAKDFAQALAPQFEALSLDTKTKTQMLNLHTFEMTIQNMIEIPWFRYFIKIDPSTYLKKITCPTYVLQGEKDIQVLAEPNLNAIQTYLEMAGNDNFSVQLYSKLNHLFQTCHTCTIQEYGTLKESFSQEVMADMADWLKSNILNKKK